MRYVGRPFLTRVHMLCQASKQCQQGAFPALSSYPTGPCMYLPRSNCESRYEGICKGYEIFRTGMKVDLALKVWLTMSSRPLKFPSPCSTSRALCIFFTLWSLPILSESAPPFFLCIAPCRPLDLSSEGLTNSLDFHIMI